MIGHQSSPGVMTGPAIMKQPLVCASSRKIIAPHIISGLDVAEVLPRTVNHDQLKLFPLLKRSSFAGENNSLSPGTQMRLSWPGR